MAKAFRFAIAFAGAFALAGCSGSEENEAPAAENVEVNSFEVANDMILPETAPEPEPAGNAAAPIPLPDATPAMDAVPEDTQVQDDAAAAGMTSRIQRDEAPAANQDAPAE